VVLLMEGELTASFVHAQANLAGQLAARSRRIYQTDVAAFLWWLRAHLAGETPGRYEDRAREEHPSSPAEDAARLSGLTREAVIAYRAYLDPTTASGKRPYAKATALRRLTVVRRLCAEAILKGLLAENPTEGVRGFRGAAREETPHTALTLKQLHQLLEAIGTPTLKDVRDKALLTVLARLGLRREEASQLDWSHLEQRQGHTGPLHPA